MQYDSFVKEKESARIINTDSLMRTEAACDG